ncbi:hypothetical protein GGTG_02164 [Gaeumannomyces tritici R3-111a-1]|uniref:Uncharacterized protein n=1 Tax=Gaeumannomyces tritici (strain R3-111a-1) TaxID=644352 RepID=J3NLL5_GAET3|nr:hypothetical protein GGTG_02164 [Gaeumannomyces tritici R3-111a-1]EJT82190.1 hypothetical protein GGTG_02164 [Gaeumannomyces tritici R3-111a-1]
MPPLHNEPPAVRKGYEQERRETRPVLRHLSPKPHRGGAASALQQHLGHSAGFCASTHSTPAALAIPPRARRGGVACDAHGTRAIVPPSLDPSLEYEGYTVCIGPATCTTPCLGPEVPELCKRKGMLSAQSPAAIGDGPTFEQEGTEVWSGEPSPTAAPRSGPFAAFLGSAWLEEGRGGEDQPIGTATRMRGGEPYAGTGRNEGGWENWELGRPTGVRRIMYPDSMGGQRMLISTETASLRARGCGIRYHGRCSGQLMAANESAGRVRGRVQGRGPGVPSSRPMPE